MFKLFILVFLILNNSCLAVCKDSAAEVLVINKSSYKLRLESKEEQTCKLNFISDIEPNTKEKYFCIKHNYLLKVTTYYKKKRVAIAATDLWNDVIVYATAKIFDVKFKHLRGNEALTNPAGRESIDWQFHEHESNKHDHRNIDHSTESFSD
jgi:hypothetical protein